MTRHASALAASAETQSGVPVLSRISKATSHSKKARRPEPLNKEHGDLCKARRPGLSIKKKQGLCKAKRPGGISWRNWQGLATQTDNFQIL